MNKMEIGTINMKKSFFLFTMILLSSFLYSEVQIGLDRIFEEPYSLELKGKKIGLITNLSAINSKKENSFSLFYRNQGKLDYALKALFAPEHGFDAKLAAFEKFNHSQKDQIQIYSLHGETTRPTNSMLEGVDVVIFDLQTVGVRCYTYEATLTYMMEKAAELKIPLIVLDRPNPRGGLVVEGQTFEDKYKCFFTYNKVPFCHGFTIGELARYVNEEHQIGCHLTIVPMLGWKRSMTYEETGLAWLAPSPNIPDSETSLVYPATILLGETLEIVSVDLRGEKPFKRFGAPWLDGQEFANILNQHNLPGVVFFSQSFTPTWGKYAPNRCGGVGIKVTSIDRFQPLLTQYTIFEELMRVYPSEFKTELELAYKKGRKKACNYITGSDSLINLIEANGNIVEEMKFHENIYINSFIKKREKYLLY